jgi:hypothetical protein
LDAAPVLMDLRATTWRKDLSLATSSSIVPLPPPPAGSKRVHRLMPLGVGSPATTPSGNRPPRNGLAAASEVASDVGTRTVAAAPPARATN